MLLKKPLFRFIFLIAISYGSWFMLYEFWLKPNGSLDHFVTEYVTIGICRLLNLSGYVSHYTIALKPGETYIFIQPNIFPTVRIGASCNGLELLALFTIFIACYPGNMLYKFLYIVSGNLLIHGVNILRNYWLTILSVKHASSFEFYHRYVFILLVYGVIFMMWIGWTNYFSFLKTRR